MWTFSLSSHIKAEHGCIFCALLGWCVIICTAFAHCLGFPAAYLFTFKTSSNYWYTGINPSTGTETNGLYRHLKLETLCTTRTKNFATQVFYFAFFLHFFMFFKRQCKLRESNFLWKFKDGYQIFNLYNHVFLRLHYITHGSSFFV